RLYPKPAASGDSRRHDATSAELCRNSDHHGPLIGKTAHSRSCRPAALSLASADRIRSGGSILRRFTRTVALSLLGMIGGAAGAAEAPDSYIWLEDFKSPRVDAWVAGENAK